MSDLLKKFKQLQDAKLAAANTSIAPVRTVAQETAIKKAPTDSPMARLLAKSTGGGMTASAEVTASTSTEKAKLGNLLSLTRDKVSSANKVVDDAVEARLISAQERGLYDVPDEARSLDGLDADLLLAKMRDLDAATVAKTPEIPSLCREIRANLEQYPELTHILSDEQLGIIVKGYLVQADVETSPKTTQAKSAKATKVVADLASLSIDELF